MQSERALPGHFQEGEWTGLHNDLGGAGDAFSSHDNLSADRLEGFKLPRRRNVADVVGDRQVGWIGTSLL